MIFTATDYSLLPHNTFGVEARAATYASYTQVEELRHLLAQYAGRSVLAIGAGSNLLFTRNYPGVVLHSCIKGIEVIQEDDESVWVRAGSGVVWDDLVAHAVARQWGGLENLSGIPGEVGASAVQNVGAYGAEAKDCIDHVETVALKDGSCRTFTVGECEYSYRDSIFKKSIKGQYIVTYVTYRLSRQPQFKLDYGSIRETLAGREVTLQAVRDAVLSIRAAKLPDYHTLGSAGSFFMNPVVEESKARALLALYPAMPHYQVEGGVKIPAGWMIEQCGWKGRSLGHAAVYEKQALVLVNLGGATGEEVMTLAHAVTASVKEKFGITLSMEANIIGEE